MKTTLRISLIVFCAALFCAFLPADECTMYAPSKEGAELEMKNYSANDKLEGRNVLKVISVNKGVTGQSVQYRSESFDKKDKPVGTSTIVMKCEGGNFLVDMQNMITNEQREAFKDMTLTIEGSQLEIPGNPTVGQMLKDGEFNMKGRAEGSPIGLNLNMKITNRKVAAIEDVVVPAGTFKCVKITYDGSVKLMVRTSFKGADWYAKDIGLVRSETYSTKDKLQNYSVLASKK